MTDGPQTPAAPVELLLITGMSGAGRSTAARGLEDLGWFVVDNLPPALLPTLAELAERSGGAVGRLAVVADVRGRAFFADLRSALAALQERPIDLRIVFLEASDEALVRRFEGVRRPHPLQAEGRISDGILAERALLADLRREADLVIDTTELTVHQLRAKIDAVGHGGGDLRITVLSFGFKYGLPLDADLVFDLRFLPNPFWEPELRPQTGRDAAVADYVLGQPDAGPFLTHAAALLGACLPGYRTEGRRYLTVAVGCTGGKHRSVAVAEALAERLRVDGSTVQVAHRDLGRE
jgi:UPF0042 nucleotide-binding protein